MKNLLLLPTVLVLFSCSSQKNSDLSKATVNPSDCPKDGICTVRLEKNKSLDIKTDEFGSIYYNLLESTDKNVIVYEFSRGFDKELQDSGYREEIVIEIDTANPEMELSDFTLEHAKVLFGRFCYCKGATGLFKIRDGNLSVKKSDSGLSVKMDFKITEVPQVIEKIDITVQ